MKPPPAPKKKRTPRRRALVASLSASPPAEDDAKRRSALVASLYSASPPAEDDAKLRRTSLGKEIAVDDGLLCGTINKASPSPADPPPQPPSNVRSFECSICDKAFPSFQALGGHMTSHRGKRTAPAAAGAAAASVVQEGEKTHECSKCDKSFSTGQALGGHMRRHYVGSIVSGGRATTKSATTKETTAASSSVKRRDFDLNEPAEPLSPELGWL
ncbi:hypothetical protein Cni_G03117 [Canna indica]|uniref:C2H2-type domain-containing protein n=1 Tax=Canna indica TaxID=4628 RepID=A0AAQ3JU05_9LILI|nr:hypothetical protein Cni_G03117 [Canna indica]